MQQLDLRYNSLSGRVPRALLGFTTGEGTTAAALATLREVALFQQRGQRLCAHVSSTDAPVPTQPFRIDGVDVAARLAAAQGGGGAACAAPAAQQLTEAYDAVAGEQAPAWLRVGAKGAPESSAAFIFPSAGRGQPPAYAEAWLGLCDLPEMMALRCGPAAASSVR